MISLPYISLTPVVFYGCLRLINWVRKYREARKFNIPIVLIPVSFEDVWWMPLRPLFAWVDRLPFGLGSWYVYTEMGWTTVDGCRTTTRLGENFVLCSPTRNVIVTCYIPAANQIYRDHALWTMPEAQSQLFAFYGQNVSSTDGAEWQRHRKVTASAFNETCVEQTWHTAIRKSAELELRDSTLGGLRSIFNLLAMEVLAEVGFGKDEKLSAVPTGHRQSLMDSLGFIMQNIMLTLLFNSLKAPDWIRPHLLRKLKLSVAEFQLYMKEHVLREMQSPRSSGMKTLLGAMVAANEGEKTQLLKGGRPSYLTDSELYGNLFVFNLAGYETTASSMSFALPFLAASPEAQEWIVEEIDSVYARGQADYAATYPRLVRCLAWMYETLRLASPAPLLVRMPRSPQELPIIAQQGPSKIVVPPGTLVGGHFYGAHLSPRWGKDVLDFNPKRFVLTTEDGKETLKVPEQVLFMPWIAGPRVCPGKKFSQVEFVAVVVELLSKYRVELVSEVGETKAATRARVLSVMEEKYFNVSSHFRKPEAASIRFVERDVQHARGL